MDRLLLPEVTFIQRASNASPESLPLVQDARINTHSRADLFASSNLEFVEERMLNLISLDRFEAEFKLLQHVDQFLAVD